VKIALTLGLFALIFAACAGRRLPPGTPPPEYEPPVVAPWPQESSDAGTATNTHDSAEATDASPAAGQSELSLDAGPR